MAHFGPDLLITERYVNFDEGFMALQCDDSPGGGDI